MTYKGLPLYKVTIVDEAGYEEDESIGMQCVSFVDDPAVESDFLRFEKEEQKKLTFAINQEQRIITGCAIRANYPIYRNGGISGKPFYVIFQKDDIKKIVERYSKEQRFNSTSLQHDGTPLQNVYLVEMYIKDVARGICPNEFENIEDGSLFMSYKIDDDELWKRITSGGDINGFSIEIASYLELIDKGADEFSAEDELEQFIADAVSEDKKKIDFVDESSLTNAIDQNKVVLLDVDGEKHKCQILEKAYKDVTENGRSFKKWYAVYYDLDENDWKLKTADEIKSIKITSKPLQKPWEELMTRKAYLDILDQLDDMNTAVDKVATSPRELIYQAIDEGLYLMINYNDEQPNPHTGARQCKVVAYGYTHRGNECIRIYEDSGDSRSKHEPRFRLMLTRRIMNMRAMPFMEHWNITDLDPLYYNPDGDNSMYPVIKWRDK